MSAYKESTYDRVGQDGGEDGIEYHLNLVIEERNELLEALEGFIKGSYKTSYGAWAIDKLDQKMNVAKQLIQKIKG